MAIQQFLKPMEIYFINETMIDFLNYLGYSFTELCN